MSSAPLLYESHSHTPLCNHAFGEPEDYAGVAERRGFKGLIVTCHCPLPDGISAEVRMDPAQFEDYLAMIARARAAFAGRVDVRAGLESCKEFGAHGVLVLGHRDYYPRFGFSAETAALVVAPYSGSPSFMAIALEKGAFDAPLSVAYPEAFSGG